MDGDVVYSMVKDTPIVFKADCLARVIDVPATGPCPYTTHLPYTEYLSLQYSDQLKLILGNNFDSSSTKPLVSQLTPLALLLFKLFHSNVMPRKSGRDRITFQDSILLSLFLSGKPFNVSLLLIRNMNHSVSHDSKLLPYPALLTKVFNYFHIINDSDFSEKISSVFDNSILTANSLVVNSENVLVFSSVPRTFTGTTSNPVVSTPQLF